MLWRIKLQDPWQLQGTQRRVKRHQEGARLARQLVQQRSASLLKPFAGTRTP
jgi:hypothetical protein